jgi:hypothetical protein
MEKNPWGANPFVLLSTTVKAHFPRSCLCSVLANHWSVVLLCGNSPHSLTEVSPTWEAAKCATTQSRTSQHFMEPEGSLPPNVQPLNQELPSILWNLKVLCRQMCRHSIKNFPAFYGTLRFIAMFTKAFQLVPILSQINALLVHASYRQLAVFPWG